MLANATIFSGDLGGDDDPDDPWNPALKDDNVWQVFELVNLGDTTLIDGITVTGAWNKVSAPPDGYGWAGEGGGMLLRSGTPGYTSTPFLQNCRFIRNLASDNGGAIYAHVEGIVENGHEDPANYPSVLKVRTCVFRDNQAYLGGGESGGAMFLERCELDMAGCLLADNFSNLWGAGVFMHFPTGLAVTNCTITNNISDDWQAIGWEIHPDQADTPPTFRMQSSILTGNLLREGGSPAGNGQVSGDNGNVALDLHIDYCILAEAYPSNPPPPGDGLQAIMVPDFFVDNSNEDVLSRDYHILPVGNCRGPIDLGTTDLGSLPSDEHDADGDTDTEELVPPVDLGDYESGDTRLRPRIDGWPALLDIGAYEAYPGNYGCLADLDNDGSVGSADLSILLGQWGTCGCACADLDGNGTTGAADLAVLLGAWGGCPAYKSATAANEPMSPNEPTAPDPQELAELLGFSSVEELAEWLGTLDAQTRATILSVLGGS